MIWSPAIHSESASNVVERLLSVQTSIRANPDTPNRFVESS